MEHVIKIEYGDDVRKVIFDNLDIRAETIGINMCDSFGTERSLEFYSDLCNERDDLKIAIIPGNDLVQNTILLSADVLGIYLHRDALTDLSNRYDIWITVKSDEVIFRNNLPDLLSDSVIEARMKETLSLDNIPFTYNSLPGHPLVRIPDDWFVEFPPNTEDNKLLAGGALKYIQDNLDIVTNVIKDAKDRINRTTIPMGVILDYTEYPIIRGAMRDTPKGPYVLIKIGMVNFGFSVQRAMTFDWYGLMVAELYLLTGE